MIESFIGRDQTKSQSPVDRYVMTYEYIHNIL